MGGEREERRAKREWDDERAERRNRMELGVACVSDCLCVCLPSLSAYKCQRERTKKSLCPPDWASTLQSADRTIVPC